MNAALVKRASRACQTKSADRRHTNLIKQSWFVGLDTSIFVSFREGCFELMRAISGALCGQQYCACHQDGLNRVRFDNFLGSVCAPISDNRNRFRESSSTGCAAVADVGYACG
jgi:hypothetical protein